MIMSFWIPLLSGSLLWLLDTFLTFMWTQCAVLDILHTFCMKDSTNDDVIKWKNFPRYWPFVRGIHRSPVNSPHKGQWRGALIFPVICAWINDWVNNRDAGDLRRHRAHYDIIVMRARPWSQDTRCFCNCEFYFHYSDITWASWRL